MGGKTSAMDKKDMASILVGSVSREEKEVIEMAGSRVTPGQSREKDTSGVEEFGSEEARLIFGSIPASLPTEEGMNVSNTMARACGKSSSPLTVLNAEWPGPQSLETDHLSKYLEELDEKEEEKEEEESGLNLGSTIGEAADGKGTGGCTGMVAGGDASVVWKCDLCRLVCADRYSLEYHRRKDHQPSVRIGLAPDQVIEFAKDENGKFVCRCGKQFSIGGNLRRHVRLGCSSVPLVEFDKATEDEGLLVEEKMLKDLVADCDPKKERSVGLRGAYMFHSNVDLEVGNVGGVENAALASLLWQKMPRAKEIAPGLSRMFHALFREGTRGCRDLPWIYARAIYQYGEYDDQNGIKSTGKVFHPVENEETEHRYSDAAARLLLFCMSRVDKTCQSAEPETLNLPQISKDDRWSLVRFHQLLCIYLDGKDSGKAVDSSESVLRQGSCGPEVSSFAEPAYDSGGEDEDDEVEMLDEEQAEQAYSALRGGVERLCPKSTESCSIYGAIGLGDSFLGEAFVNLLTRVFLVDAYGGNRAVLLVSQMLTVNAVKPNGKGFKLPSSTRRFCAPLMYAARMLCMCLLRLKFMEKDKKHLDDHEFKREVQEEILDKVNGRFVTGATQILSAAHMSKRFQEKKVAEIYPTKTDHANRNVEWVLAGQRVSVEKIQGLVMRRSSQVKSQLHALLNNFRRDEGLVDRVLATGDAEADAPLGNILSLRKEVARRCSQEAGRFRNHLTSPGRPGHVPDLDRFLLEDSLFRQHLWALMNWESGPVKRVSDWLMLRLSNGLKRGRNIFVLHGRVAVYCEVQKTRSVKQMESTMVCFLSESLSRVVVTYMIYVMPAVSWIHTQLRNSPTAGRQATEFLLVSASGELVSARRAGEMFAAFNQPMELGVRAARQVSIAMQGSLCSTEGWEAVAGEIAKTHGHSESTLKGNYAQVVGAPVSENVLGAALLISQQWHRVLFPVVLGSAAGAAGRGEKHSKDAAGGVGMAGKRPLSMALPAAKAARLGSKRTLAVSLSPQQENEQAPRLGSSISCVPDAENVGVASEAEKHPDVSLTINCAPGLEGNSGGLRFTLELTPPVGVLANVCCHEEIEMSGATTGPDDIYPIPRLESAAAGALMVDDGDQPCVGSVVTRPGIEFGSRVGQQTGQQTKAAAVCYTKLDELERELESALGPKRQEAELQQLVRSSGRPGDENGGGESPRSPFQRWRSPEQRLLFNAAWKADPKRALNTLAVMGTGSGKSSILNHGLPGTTLLIVPYVVLKAQSVRRAREEKHEARHWSSSLDYSAAARGESLLMVVGMEEFCGQAFGQHMRSNPVLFASIRRVVVDEIHVVFTERSYRKALSSLVWQVDCMFPDVSRFFLSATMPPDLELWLKAELGGDSAGLYTLRQRGKTPPEHITLDILPDGGNGFYKSEEEGLAALVECIGSWAASYSSAGRCKSDGTLLDAPQCIVYVCTVEALDRVKHYLERSSVTGKLLVSSWMSAYRPEMAEDESRRLAQEAEVEKFQAGSTRVMVATSGYGAGVDNSRVNLVVMFGAPKRLEYVAQMAGRAGRLGQVSQAVVMLLSRPAAGRAAAVDSVDDVSGSAESGRPISTLLVRGKCPRQLLQAEMDGHPERPDLVGRCQKCQVCREASVPPPTSGTVDGPRRRCSKGSLPGRPSTVVGEGIGRRAIVVGEAIDIFSPSPDGVMQGLGREDNPAAEVMSSMEARTGGSGSAWVDTTTRVAPLQPGRLVLVSSRALRTRPSTISLLREQIPGELKESLCLVCFFRGMRPVHRGTCAQGIMCWSCGGAHAKSKCGVRVEVEKFNRKHNVCCQCGLPCQLPQSIFLFRGLHVPKGSSRLVHKNCNLGALSQTRMIASLAFWWSLYPGPASFLAPSGQREIQEVLKKLAAASNTRAISNESLSPSTRYLEFLDLLLLRNEGNNIGVFVAQVLPALRRCGGGNSLAS